MKRMTIVAVATLVAAMPVAAPAQVAGLGLTAAQLEDADLVDAAGDDIGEVEHAVIGPNGKATALIVELNRPDPQRDKLVRIGMAGLKAVPQKDDPGDYDIIVATPVAKLMAMPTWRPQ